jgi:hypothetical protein
MSIKVSESVVDLDAILNRLGYNDSQINEMMQYDVFLLPNDLESPESYFVDKSVKVKNEIAKKLRIAVITRQGAKSHYQAQRAAEIVLPVLVFLGWQAFDIGKDILASMIYDMYVRYRYRGRVPNAKLRCVVVDKKRQIRKELEAEGPANDLAKILREFKLAS